jgi:transposase
MTEKKDAPKKPATAAKKEVNKSEEIRKVATGMKAKNEKPRPVKIIEILKKQGIEVSSPQVSMVLKRMGFRPRKRSKVGAVKSVGVKSSRKGSVTVEDLVAAKKVVSQFGSADKAIAAIQALKQFS